MTNAAALLHHMDQPHIADMAEAVHLDAAALATDWSRGDVLSMISAQSVATEKTVRILLVAAASALNDAGDGAMAGLIEAYMRGRAAELQFANRDRWTEDALESGADDVEGLAEDIGARFRKAAARVAA